MKKPLISEMTLRQKIGQTAMPGPRPARAGMKACGGYDKYFAKYPYAGFFLHEDMKYPNEETIASPGELFKVVQEASEACDFPLLVSCDEELGAKGLFDELHRISSNMSVGAASNKELTYQRCYYYARELRSCGVNWWFGPVCDMVPNFFNSSVRCFSDRPEAAIELLPEIIRGLHDAGVGATAKHYPGKKGDYRNSHYSTTINKLTRQEWDESYGKIWAKAVEAGVDSIMVGHNSFPDVDPTMPRGKVYIPATASKKILDILRVEMGYEGVILTDAVSMKGVTSAYDHEDVYIECFNAGNDLILFCQNDYIDVMEKAVLDGRVSMERLDESVQRILDLKEKLGLFEGKRDPMPLTEEENLKFEQANYGIGQKAITLLNNEDKMIPFDAAKVKNVTIINLSPNEGFMDELQEMVRAFEEKGIRVNLQDCLHSKDELKNLSETEDIIIYAAFLLGEMATFNRQQDKLTLFHALSFGAEKSVAVSFGVPTIYYDYFEAANAYLNAYSSDGGTMRAFVDGILGEFEFTAKSPVEIRPRFAK